MGAALLAVSHNPVEKLSETKTRLSIEFPIGSDPDLAGARELGIVFQREGRRPLPVPAIYVIGKDGNILFSYVHPDYSVRLDPGVLIAAAEAAGNGA
jgi:peroxiredoxin